MKAYIKKMQSALGLNARNEINNLDYKQFPFESNPCYNTVLAFGNVNLMAGRLKTKNDANEIINKFIKLPLP